MNEVLKDLWHDKPLLIAVAVGIGAVVFILIKNSNASAASSTGSSTGTSQDASSQVYPAAPAATYVEDSYYNYQNNSNNPIHSSSSSTSSNTTNTSNVNVHTTTNNKTSTSTTTQSSTPTPVTTKAKVLPAATGSLNGTTHSAGKGDTNFWVYSVAAGSTIASVTSKIANWGGKWQQLVNYRNNAAILQSVGVDISNPNSAIPAGTLISV